MTEVLARGDGGLSKGMASLARPTKLSATAITVFGNGEEILKGVQITQANENILDDEEMSGKRKGEYKETTGGGGVSMAYNVINVILHSCWDHLFCFLFYCI